MTSRRKVLVIGANTSIISNYLENLTEDTYEVFRTYKSTKNFTNDKNHVYELDLNNHDSITNFRKLIQGKSFDFILFSIGATSGIPLESDSLEHIENTIRVNMASQVFLLPILFDKLTDQGTLCYIGSAAADGNSYDVAYAACKGGLRAAVSSFVHTRELGNKRIIVLEPSLVEGSTMYHEMTEANIERHRSKHGGELLRFKDIGELLRKIMLMPQDFETIVAFRPGEEK